MRAVVVAVSCVVMMALSLPACIAVNTRGALVPPLVDEDPRLNAIEISVAGHTRRIHIATFGDPDNPVLLALHGSVSDFRSLLSFRAFADRYFVVMWDQRGCGLSERITKEEYTIDAIVEEIAEIKERYSPGRPVTLIGHSFGAMYSALYMSRRPDDVFQAVLLEPAALSGDIMQETFRDMVDISLFDRGLNETFWQSEVLSPSDHNVMDYKALQMLQNGKITKFHCDPDHPSHYPVWRPGAHVEILRAKMLTDGTRFVYDFTAGLDRFPQRVLLLGSDCSAIGYQFQLEHHAALFRDARVVEIRGAGHRLMCERPDAVGTAVRDYLSEYQ